MLAGVIRKHNLMTLHVARSEGIECGVAGRSMDDEKPKFHKHSAALATAARTLPLSLPAQAASSPESLSVADILNPGEIRVAGIRMIAVAAL